MIMLADIDNLVPAFRDFADALHALGKDSGLDVRAVHEEIFDAMHHI